MSAIELALICGTFFAIINVNLLQFFGVDISPKHRTERSDDEEVAGVDDGIRELSPHTFIIRTFVSDDVNFLRATEEPADERERNETANDAERHVRFATVGFPVVSELNDYDSQRDENYESEEDVVPNEEGIGETRDIQEVTGNLETTAGSAEEEHRDEDDAQRQQAPKGNLRNHFIVFHKVIYNLMI